MRNALKSSRSKKSAFAGMWAVSAGLRCETENTRSLWTARELLGGGALTAAPKKIGSFDVLCKHFATSGAFLREIT